MASATMTLQGVSGASNVDMTNTTLPIVYGGFVGTCSNPDNASTCDTCTTNLNNGGTVSFQPCSYASVYENLNLVFTFQSTQAFTNATVTMSDGTNSYTPTNNVGTTVNYAVNAPITVTIPWSSICQYNSTSCTGGTDGSVTSLTMTFTVTSGTTTGTTTTTTTTATTDSMTVNMVFRFVDATASTSVEYYTPCTSTDADDTTPDGMCGFTLFPGDGKAYITEADYATDYPTISSTGGDGSTTYSGIAVWYSTPQGDQSTSYDVANDITSIAGITTASGHTVISIDNTQSPPALGDARIEGLSNNTRYCFAIGNQDLTGIISNMTPVGNSSFITSSNAYNYCAEPSEVVGLLDDKHCFIATAAWGSVMAPQVQSFRDFRNKFLVPFAGGRRLIKAYYTYGPRYARMIAHNEGLRSVARAALWPPLLFAKVAVNMGFFPALLMLLTLAFLLWESARWLKKLYLQGEL